ncbi:MAG: hypothetical protein M0R37_08695 [Bacteroidales bacterium]|nr:hypothetical protein [Bacteroidales bacterium]
MKVVITSQGNTPESIMDRHFGRCAYFVFYDTDSDSTEFVPNANKDNLDGVGLESARFVAAKGAKTVISGDFGEKVKPLFDQLQIQLIMIPDSKKTISQIIKVLKRWSF